MDYTNLGLNSNLQPINSPIVENAEKKVTAYDFNANYERNTVTAMNIQNFSFSQGQGGTLALGGAGNGNGVMSVYDTGGTEHVRLDNTGLTVSDGSITLKNASGTSFVDSAGLVAAAITNYGTTYTFGTGFVTSVAGTNAADTNYATVSVVVTRNTPILFLGDVTSDVWTAQPAGTSYFRGYLYTKMKLNGTLISQNMMKSELTSVSDDNTGNMPISLHSFNILTAGTHSITFGGSISYQAGLGTPSAQIRGVRLTAFYIGT